MKNTTRFAAFSLILAAGLLAGCCNNRCEETDGASAEAGKPTASSTAGNCGFGGAKSEGGCCGGAAETKPAAGCCDGAAK